MNRVILIGNLANDPEYKEAGGVARCSFRLAVQRRYADSSGVRQADFLPVICWRGLAETCAKYLAKGRKCAVEGSLQTRSYESQDGVRRYVTEIIADNVEFLGTAGAGDPGPTPPPERRAEPGQPTGRERYSATSPSNLERSGNMPGVAATQSEIAGQPTQQMSFTEVDDSELPF